MKFVKFSPARLALLTLVAAISTSGISASVLATSTRHNEAQPSALVIAQDSRPARTPPPPPPTTRKAPTRKQPARKPTPNPQEPSRADDNAPLVYVLMQTSMGGIVIELNREKAPITVRNFLSYADKKYYDGTIYHRVIQKFMIQGGGFTEGMKKKTTDRPIKNEWQNGLKNVYGSIAMARLGRQPDSATSQFFINVKDNASLDVPRDGAGYAVFGKVVAGMKVVRMIEGSLTITKQGRPNVPAETIFVKTVSRMSEDDAKMRIAQEKKATTTRESGTQ